MDLSGNFWRQGYYYIVKRGFSEVICWVVKVASTWANHISESEGHNGGSFTDTVVSVAAYAGVGEAAPPTEGSGSAIVRVTNVD